MADVIDQAQAFEEMERAAALSRVLGRYPGQGPDWVDGRPCCRECGEEIPARRLEDLGPGCELCVDCQEELES